jgi:alpha-galactosidase
VRLQGLDPNATYRIRPLDAAKYKGEAAIQGSFLMGAGLELNLVGDYDSTAVVLEKVVSQNH